MNTDTQHHAQLLIIGQSLDALVTTVVMASLGYQVTIAYPYQFSDIAKSSKNLDEIMQDHRFDHQLSALWQMYVNHQKICIIKNDHSLSDIINQTLLKPPSSCQKDHVSNKQPYHYLWLFVDEMPELTLQEKRILSNHRLKIVLSGVLTIGSMHVLSRQIINPHIFYIPFVFLQNNDSYHDMLNPSLLLIGEKTPNTSQQLEPLLPLLEQAEQSAITDICTVEFVRSGIMTLLATRLSFINELSMLAEQHSVNMNEISRLMGLDKRIGQGYLQAGWGFGGHSLPKELSALCQSFLLKNLDNHLMQAVDTINESQKEWLFQHVWRYFQGFIQDKTMVIWGGSYKSGSGSTQNSAIHTLLHLLWQYDVTTKVCAFEANMELSLYYQNAIKQGKLIILDEPYQLENADALLILNWSGRQRPNIEYLNHYALPIFDGKNIFSMAQVGQLAGDYVGVGRFIV